MTRGKLRRNDQGLLKGSNGLVIFCRPDVRSALFSQRRKCECGEMIGVDCILDNCQCQNSPPSECLKCLTRNAPIFPEGEFDWRYDDFKLWDFLFGFK